MGSHLASPAARIADGRSCRWRAKMATVKIGCLNQQSALAIALSTIPIAVNSNRRSPTSRGPKGPPYLHCLYYVL